jgi:hypothetical protein
MLSLILLFFELVMRLRVNLNKSEIVSVGALFNVERLVMALGRYAFRPSCHH